MKISITRSNFNDLTTEDIHKIFRRITYEDLTDDKLKAREQKYLCKSCKMYKLRREFNRDFKYNRVTFNICKTCEKHEKDIDKSCGW